MPRNSERRRRRRRRGGGENEPEKESVLRLCRHASPTFSVDRRFFSFTLHRVTVHGTSMNTVSNIYTYEWGHGNGPITLNIHPSRKRNKRDDKSASDRMIDQLMEKERANERKRNHIVQSWYTEAGRRRCEKKMLIQSSRVANQVSMQSSSHPIRLKRISLLITDVQLTSREIRFLSFQVHRDCSNENNGKFNEVRSPEERNNQHVCLPGEDRNDSTRRELSHRRVFEISFVNKYSILNLTPLSRAIRSKMCINWRQADLDLTPPCIHSFGSKHFQWQQNEYLYASIANLFLLNHWLADWKIPRSFISRSNNCRIRRTSGRVRNSREKNSYVNQIDGVREREKVYVCQMKV